MAGEDEGRKEGPPVSSSPFKALERWRDWRVREINEVILKIYFQELYHPKSEGFLYR